MHRIFIVAAAVFAASAISVSELSAQAPATNAARVAARKAIQRGPTPSVLPGTQESAFSVIQGNALSSSNGPLVNRIVRLRDARLGRILDSQVTDGSGLFAFRPVDPGNYVVELMSNDQTVMAASQVLSVNAGEAVSAVVRLPFRIPAGASIPTAAATVTSVAATAGVLAQGVVTTSTPDASPR
jgi:hypothetical protein